MDYLVKKKLIKKNLAGRDKIANPKSSKFTIDASEDNKCPICLVIPIQDQSFANKCQHSFCKICLLEWAKIRQECPLCRAPFTSVIFNVKSDTDYKEVKLADLINKKFSNGHYNLSASFLSSPFLSNLVQATSLRNAFFFQNFSQHTRSSVNEPISVSINLRPGSIEHRRYIYSSEKYVLPCGNGITSRRREANPNFFRSNPSCMHRLLPFLEIELRALIHNANERTIVSQIITGSLTEVKINSTGFQRLISQYFLNRTVHFIHEFFNFAISVFESVTNYYEEAIYMPKAESQVVQIENFNQNDNVVEEANMLNDDNEEEIDNGDNAFDFTDPYNNRSQRNIYNQVNSAGLSSFFMSNQYMRNQNTLVRENSDDRDDRDDRNRTTNLVEESDDSDVEIVYEGSRLENDLSNAQRSTPREPEPKPSTSGLQNTRLNYSAQPTSAAYHTDDSDISDDEYYKKSKNLNLNSYLESDDNDESVDVEIVGYLKPRHLRTPEIIEITDDEDDYEIETNMSVKRVKRESNNFEDEESKPVEFKCRCKVKCKVACKKLNG